MKKIITLAIAAAGALWAFKQSKKSSSQDNWAQATDKV